VEADRFPANGHYRRAGHRSHIEVPGMSPLSSEPVVKRGARKAFREFLNVTYRDSQKHRHNLYHQRTREYGDYLYSQDRDMFNVEFYLAMEGKCPGFDHTKWVADEK
jgi:hypothetical protein